jgi:hypothetical protein
MRITIVVSTLAVVVTLALSPRPSEASASVAKPSVPTQIQTIQADKKGPSKTAPEASKTTPPASAPADQPSTRVAKPGKRLHAAGKRYAAFGRKHRYASRHHHARLVDGYGFGYRHRSLHDYRWSGYVHSVRSYGCCCPGGRW